MSRERPLTGGLREDGEPLGLVEYEKGGGYRGLKKALASLSPAEVTEEVKDAKLRGRGGAGFPTGMKWGFVPGGEGAPRPRYLVANADEMEPGTFKDRLLMERNPHLLLEGMLIASYAIQAETGYVFLRWAYRESEQAIRRAIGEARGAGYLGRNILGTGFDADIHVHVSAGRYMCGEETGLLNALEGKRATPRSKPPYPQVSGLWGKPTIVQNVETLCCLPHLIAEGAGRFRELGSENDGGTKLYGVSGKVKRPGLWELPMGATAGEIIRERAGGLREGLSLRGFLPGGASTDFLLPEHLDLPMTFDTLQEAGSRLGTGTMVVLDDGTCPVAMVQNMETFFGRESCGWCTPCRDGLPWAARTLAAIDAGEGTMEDLDRLAGQCKLLGPGHTFCALAPGAAEPLGSALEHFRDDFERHVREKRCPWRSA